MRKIYAKQLYRKLQSPLMNEENQLRLDIEYERLNDRRLKICKRKMTDIQKEVAQQKQLHNGKMARLRVELDLEESQLELARTG